MDSVEILKNTPLSAQENMRIVSEVLDPIVNTTNLIRFQVPRAGILRPGSIVTFKIKSATDLDCFLPLKTGCFSAFSRVELMLGSRRLQVVEKSALHNTIKNQFKPCEEQYGLGMVQNGIVTRLSNNTSDNGRMILKDTIQVGSSNDFKIPERYRITSTHQTEWSVKLSDLFPMLADLSLPLGNLNENLFINLHLNTQINTTRGDRTQPIAVFSQSYTADTSVTVDKDSFQLVADIVYFDDEKMASLNEKLMDEEGISMIVDDLIVVTNQTANLDVSTETAPLERIISSDLALNGLSVKNVVIADRNLTYIGDNADAGLVGEYSSQAYVKPNSIQMRVNDLNVYPRKLINEQRKIQEVTNCFDNDLYVSNPEYSFNQVSTKSGVFARENNLLGSTSTLHGFKLSESLQGMSHYEGVDISVDRPGRQGVVANKKINVLRETYPSPTVSDIDSREQTFFCTTEKMVMFRNGGVTMVN